jgi:hypothetical protein
MTRRHYKRLVEYLIQRKASYLWLISSLLQKVKPTPAADMALADLVRFCRASSDTIGKTDRDTYILIGRRQVFLRMTQHLKLSPEQLTELYFQYQPPEDDDE